MASVFCCSGHLPSFGLVSYHWPTPESKTGAAIASRKPTARLPDGGGVVGGGRGSTMDTEETGAQKRKVKVFEEIEEDT